VPTSLGGTFHELLDEITFPREIGCHLGGHTAVRRRNICPGQSLPCRHCLERWILICALLIGLGIYVYIALAVQTIAEKTNTENPWLAWIPIANFILLLNIARKPIWWIVLILIPLVNIVIIVMIWMAVAEARNKPSWWGILMIVPGVSIIVPGYLAWAE